MRAPKSESVSFAQDADTVYAAALGVHQNAKSSDIIGVQKAGRYLMIREKSMMSNRKFHVVSVVPTESGSELRVVVGSDTRTPAALMDGKANAKSLAKFVDNVKAAAQSGSPVAGPIANFYVSGKDQVPWDDPDEEPQIEIGGTIKAILTGL